MKKTFFSFILILIFISFGLSSFAQSAYDVSIPQEITNGLNGTIEQLKNFLSSKNTWSLPNDANISDIQSDMVYVKYTIDYNKLMVNNNLKESLIKSLYIVTTKAKDLPYIECWIKEDNGRFYYAGHGRSAQYLADANASCKSDGNISTNIVYDMDTLFLIAVTEEGQEIAYPIGEVASGYISGEKFVSLDRLRYNCQVTYAYNKEKYANSLSGGGITTLMDIPNSFVIPTSINKPVDYMPVAKSSEAINQNAPSQSNMDVILYVSIAAVIILATGSILILRKNKTKKTIQ